MLGHLTYLSLIKVQGNLALACATLDEIMIVAVYLLTLCFRFRDNVGSPYLKVKHLLLLVTSI